MSIFSTASRPCAGPCPESRSSPSSAAPAAPGRSRPRPTPRSPPRTAAQLLVDVQKARLDGLSGTVVQRADLGPARPCRPLGRPGRLVRRRVRQLRPHLAGLGHPHAAALVRRARTAPASRCSARRRVRRHPQRQRRVDLVEPGQDRDAHAPLPAEDARHQAAAPAPGTDRDAQLPQQAADLALKAITPSTTVTTERHRRRGRPLGVRAGARRPQDPARWSASVRIAIDGQTARAAAGPGLRQGLAEPAFEVAFTSVDFGRPGRRAVRVQPAAGHQGHRAHAPPRTRTRSPGDRPRPASPRSSAPAGPPSPSPPCRSRRPARAERGHGQGDARPAAQGVAAPGAGPPARRQLFSAVLTDDGRVAVGAVPPQTLYAALAAR